VTTTWSSIAAAARKSDFPLTVGNHNRAQG
jgi:hypothetical protein